MNYISTSRNLSNVMEKLIEKLDNLKVEGGSGDQERVRISAALENLEDMLSQIERQRANESKLVYKLEHFVKQSDVDEENTAAGQSLPSQVDVHRTLTAVIKGAKTVGQVIEVVANTAETLVDSISKVIYENQARAAAECQRSMARQQVDLDKPAQPVNEPVKELQREDLDEDESI